MDPLIIGFAAAGGLGFLAMLTAALSCFRKCGPNQALIVSGMFANEDSSEDFKIVIGGGCIVMPAIQQCTYLSLEPMSIEVSPKTTVTTADGTQLRVTAIAQVKVDSDIKSVAAAARNILSKSESEIKAIALDTLSGSLRAKLGTQNYEVIVREQRQIADTIEKESTAIISKLGLTVLSFSFRDIVACGKTEFAKSQEFTSI